MAKEETELVRGMHRIFMAGLPGYGHWTTDGDLGLAITGTKSQGVSAHIAREKNPCLVCHEFAHRVLVGEGEQKPNYRRTVDPTDMRTQRQQLEEEGVTFFGGLADRRLRVSNRMLREALKAASPPPSEPA